jgi:peptidoglycan/LPS O-acetylase OafA/YrhL
MTVSIPEASINPVYWTLPIELSFYLSLPYFARRLAAAERGPAAARWRTLLGMVAAVLLVTWTYRYAVFHAYAASPQLVWATSQLPGSLDQFTLGMAAAAGLRWWKADAARGVAARGRASDLLLVAGLAGLVGAMYFLHRIHGQYWSGHWALFFWHTVSGAFITAIVLSIALAGRLARALFENRAMVFVGTISYSLYLWHLPIAEWVARAVDIEALGLGLFLAISVPLILAASALSYYLVEWPFLRAPGPPRGAPSS